jgi:hypothetical protein
MSNGATAVKGAWSGAAGVHRSEAETLDRRGSGVAMLWGGDGDELVGFGVYAGRAKRAGDAGWEHAKRAGLSRRGAKPPKRRRDFPQGVFVFSCSMVFKRCSQIAIAVFD